MEKLRPTLWRTCRVLANRTRLSLLWEIFKGQELCVAELAKRVGIAEHSASTQLRALNARGLITSHRKNLKVIYLPQANAEVEGADALLHALQACAEKGLSVESVMKQATAFTHPRRIEIVRALGDKVRRLEELEELTGIKGSALWRHLQKLTSRRFVKKKRIFYSLTSPSNPLGKCLLEIALAD